MTVSSPGVSGAPTVLRRWQAEALPLALDSIEQGHRGVVVACTGAGKSVFLAELLRRWREAHPDEEGVLVVTTPSQALVRQLSATLADVLGAHVVGRYYARDKQWKREVVVACNASVVALAGVLQATGRPVALWVADEVHKTETSAFVVKPSPRDGGQDVEDEAEDEPDGDGPRDVGDTLQAKRRLGLTATPYRTYADERLSLFDRVVYRYSPAQALRDGVLVPWRFLGWPDDRPDEDVDVACAQMILDLGDRQKRGPGVVDADSIEDAEDYCRSLAGHGLVALPIHSRMRRADQDAAVKALRAREIDCLVHVAMLVEGVDFPWLRWGCFRRRVGSRIRFVQSLGRYLRVCADDPDKREAVIIDPHDLADAFQVAYAEALGWEDAEAKAAKDPEDDLEEREDAEEPEREKERVRTARRSALARYVRRLHLCMIAEGVCAEGGKIGGGPWRDEAASPKQVDALRRMVRVAARLGPKHRAALGLIADRPACVTKGIASDLFDLLQGARNLPGGESWAPALEVEVPPPEAFEAVADDRTYVAGATKGGWSAIAIVRDGAVLYAQARSTRRGDRWATLAESAARLAVERHGARVVCASEPDAVHLSSTLGVGARLCDRKDNPADRAAWRALRAAAESVAADHERPLARA